MSNVSPQGSLFISGLSDREARKLSRDTCRLLLREQSDKVQRESPSNAGWTASINNKIPPPPYLSRKHLSYISQVFPKENVIFKKEHKVYI